MLGRALVLFPPKHFNTNSCNQSAERPCCIPRNIMQETYRFPRRTVLFAFAAIINRIFQPAVISKKTNPPQFTGHVNGLPIRRTSFCPYRERHVSRFIATLRANVELTIVKKGCTASRTSYIFSRSLSAGWLNTCSRTATVFP